MIKDKVIVITGASSGIGKAVAELMAEEGAKVVVNDLGSNLDGSGISKQPAEEVVEGIKDKGGDAVSNADSVSEFIQVKLNICLDISVLEILREVVFIFLVCFLICLLLTYLRVIVLLVVVLVVTYILTYLPISYTHLRAHETDSYLVCRLRVEKK